MTYIGTYYGYQISFDTENCLFVANDGEQTSHKSFNEVKRQLKKKYKFRYDGLELVDGQGKIYKCGVTSSTTGFPLIFDEHGVEVYSNKWYINSAEVRNSIAEVNKHEQILKANRFLGR